MYINICVLNYAQIALCVCVCVCAHVRACVCACMCVTGLVKRGQLYIFRNTFLNFVMFNYVIYIHMHTKLLLVCNSSLIYS